MHSHSKQTQERDQSFIDHQIFRIGGDVVVELHEIDTTVERLSLGLDLDLICDR